MRGRDRFVVALRRRREVVYLGGVSLLFQVCIEEERIGRGQTVSGCMGMSFAAVETVYLFLLRYCSSFL